MSRRAAALGAAAAVALGAALVLSRGPSGPPPPADPPPPPPAPPGGGGAAAPDESSARAAALAFATAPQDWLHRSDAEVAAAVAAVAHPGAADALAEDVLAQLRAARAALGATDGRIWWLVRPLATRIERFAPPEADVVVWTLRLLAAPGAAAPQADWARVRVELDWDGTRWLLVGATDAPGPTPGSGPTDAPWPPAAFAAALEGFERVGGSEQS